MPYLKPINGCEGALGHRNKEAPNSNIQAPEKFQSPNFNKSTRGGCAEHLVGTHRKPLTMRAPRADGFLLVGRSALSVERWALSPYYNYASYEIVGIAPPGIRRLISEVVRVIAACGLCALFLGLAAEQSAGESLNGLVLDQVKQMPSGGKYSVSHFAKI